jgi:hypothetical protein
VGLLILKGSMVGLSPLLSAGLEKKSSSWPCLAAIVVEGGRTRLKGLRH